MVRMWWQQERNFQHNYNLHIDEASSGVEVFTDIEGLVHILGEDSRGETVLGVVRPLDHPLHVAGVELGVAHDCQECGDGDDEDEDGDVEDDDHLGDAHDGAEALLLGEEHVVLHVAEDGRLHEQAGTVQPLASED